MSPLAADQIHARKRPVAVFFVFLAELAWALLVATPVHAWARVAWGAHPDGDAVLFRAGGRDLLMWLGQGTAALGVTARTTIVLVAVGAVVMQMPLAALLASLAFSRGADPEVDIDAKRAPRLVSAMRASVGAVLPLAVLLVVATIAGGVVLALGALASSAVNSGLSSSLGDARAFTVHLLVFALFGVVACFIGVFFDLARAAVGRQAALSALEGVTASAWSIMMRGVKVALTTSRRGLWRATLAWAWRAALGLALIGVGYAGAQLLGGKGGMALTVLFITHQAVVLARVALRASWMARALALVAPVQDARE